MKCWYFVDTEFLKSITNVLSYSENNWSMKRIKASDSFVLEISVSGIGILRSCRRFYAVVPVSLLYKVFFGGNQCLQGTYIVLILEFFWGNKPLELILIYLIPRTR